MLQKFYKLILVTNKQSNPLDKYLAFIAECAKSGITAVQLREKNLNFNELLAFGKQLKSILKPLEIPLIINDNIELALALDADGIHLGQTDGDIQQARQKLGKKIIGLTVNSIEQIQAANTLPIEYVGVGAIFPSLNKTDVTTIWGLDELAYAATIAKVPVVAIGGINTANAHKVIQAGANGIAAIAAFHETKTPANTIKKLLNQVLGDCHA